MPQIKIENISRIFEKLFRKNNKITEVINKKKSVKKRTVGLKSIYFPIINPKINGITILKAGFVFRDVNQII